MEGIPNAKKAIGRSNPPPKLRGDPKTQRGRSEALIERNRDPNAGITLSAKGTEAFNELIAHSDIDPKWLEDIEEREPGDKDKIVRVLQNLILGARHREAFGDVGWTWSHFSLYRQKYPGIKKTYLETRRLGEEFRAICREDEAHRRAVDGVEEDVWSPSGKHCGTRIRYSDTLLAMFLKADNPDKFTERHEVKSTGVVLNMQMGLRENVRDKPMEQGDIVMESPFAEEKSEEPES
jgi:hypothetical protein